MRLKREWEKRTCVFRLAHVPPRSHLQLIAAVLRGVPHAFLYLAPQFPQSWSRFFFFWKPQTETSQWGRCVSRLDGTAALRRQSLTLSPHTQPASSPTARSICHFLLVSFSLLPPRILFFPPFCFNSGLITSHVPHQVLISSLLPRVCQTCTHARTQSQKNARARGPKPQILMLPTLACQRAHAYLKRLLRGYVLSFKHVSLERKYLHPETLIVTHAHKRRTHPLTNYIKRIPTGNISRCTSQK